MEGTARFIEPASIDVTEVPSYKHCAERIYDAVHHFYHDNTLTEKYPYSLEGFFAEVRDFGDLTKFDVGVTIGGAVSWTLVRYFLTWAIFAPFARSLKLKLNDTKKLPESLWKVIVYSLMWGLSCYILFFSPLHYDIFHEPVALWKDWTIGMDVGWPVYILYMSELSFYLHSVYGTLCMDEWRKDSIVMLFHHFLTMSLIGFSYIMRFHKVGVLVLFVHDITDILLEFTKCNVYLKVRNGVYYSIHDHMSTVGFATFSVAWFVFRLYWFPLKVLYSSAFGVVAFLPGSPDCPAFLFFNVMLWILQLLNIYWFNFIVVFLFNVLTGRQTEIDDVREFDVVNGPNSGADKGGTSQDSNGVNFTPRRSARNKSKKRD